MKTILFPTDFSENAFHAAQYAAMLARRFDAKLILLHVYGVIVPIVSESQMIYDTDYAMLQRGKDAELNLNLFSEKLVHTTDLTTVQVSQMVECGMVSDVIINTVKKMEIDLIVMGTKGASNMIDRWIGTTAENVMDSAECPVWIVPENSNLNVPLTIMYAADFKEDEVAATQKLLEITSPLCATCKVIHINEYFDLNVEPIKEIVNDLENKFKDENITFKDINRKEVVQGLETYIKTHKPDVLALAVYEKSFFGKIFDSSITKHFVQEAKIPLLIFKK